MIRRPSQNSNSSYGNSLRYSDDDYEPNSFSSWDGRERRGVSRSYDGDDRRSSHVDTVIVEQPKSEPAKPSQNWFQSNGTLLGIGFALATSGGTFIFDLYNKVKDLEYKQASLFEKIAENKQLGEEIKSMIKESDKNKKEVEQQINSLEDTVMQMYRSNKSK